MMASILDLQYDPDLGSRASLDEFFTMRNPQGRGGWNLFTMMGQALEASPDGNVVIGAPMARANSN